MSTTTEADTQAAQRKVRRVLADRGLLDPDGIGRAARSRRCEDCGREVLRGLDGDRAAGAATVDLHEIDAVGEYLALQLGLTTYSLRRGYSRKGMRIWTLDPRYSWDRKRERRTLPILVEHRCGLAIPPAREPVAAWSGPAASPAPADGGPPF